MDVFTFDEGTLLTNELSKSELIVRVQSDPLHERNRLYWDRDLSVDLAGWRGTISWNTTFSSSVAASYVVVWWAAVGPTGPVFEISNSGQLINGGTTLHVAVASGFRQGFDITVSVTRDFDESILHDLPDWQALHTFHVQDVFSPKSPT